MAFPQEPYPYPQPSWPIPWYVLPRAKYHSTTCFLPWFHLGQRAPTRGSGSSSHAVVGQKKRLATACSSLRGVQRKLAGGLHVFGEDRSLPRFHRGQIGRAGSL